MRREGFLESGLYLVLSAIFCALVCGACLLGGRVLSHYHLFLDFSPLAQLAIWENIFLNLCGWLLCVLFFNNDCWTFDSMGWPVSHVLLSHSLLTVLLSDEPGLRGAVFSKCGR